MRELWDSYEDIKERIQLYIETAYKTNDDQFNQCRKEFLSASDRKPIYTEPIYEIIPRYPKSNVPFEDLIRSCGLKESVAYTLPFESKVISLQKLPLGNS